MSFFNYRKGMFLVAISSTLLVSLCNPSEIIDSTERINIEDYYFPIDELKNGRVYEYRTIDLDNNDTLFGRFTYSVTVETDSGKYLINNNYDQTFFNDQLVVNEVVSNGILVKQYKLMAVAPGEETQIIENAEIVKGNAFPFDVPLDGGGVTPMEMKFADPNDPLEKITFIRERKYLGDTTYTFHGKDVPAVIFAANEIRQFRHIDDGDFDNTTYATEIYAKGIGLISRKYNIGDVQLESFLYDTFSMDKFEMIAEKYWNKESEIQ